MGLPRHESTRLPFLRSDQVLAIPPAPVLLSRIQFSESKFCVVHPPLSRSINWYVLRELSKQKRSSGCAPPVEPGSSPQLGPPGPRPLPRRLHRPAPRPPQPRHYPAC